MRQHFSRKPSGTAVVPGRIRRMTLSIVIPAYNEAEALPGLLVRVLEVVDSLSAATEVIIVDDGSSDDTWAVIALAAHRDDRVRGIRLSRNFGHQVALTAGLSASTGDVVVTMDADLQHPPEMIPALLAKAHDGFDVVYAVRSQSDAEGWLKIMTARLFYRAFEPSPRLTCSTGGDFRLMSRRVVDAF